MKKKSIKNLRPVKIFLVTHIFGNKSIIFLA